MNNRELPKLQGIEPGSAREGQMKIPLSPHHKHKPPELQLFLGSGWAIRAQTSEQRTPRLSCFPGKPMAAVPAHPTRGTRLTLDLAEMTHIYGVFHCTNLPVNNTENGFMLCR